MAILFNAIGHVVWQIVGWPYERAMEKTTSFSNDSPHYGAFVGRASHTRPSCTPREVETGERRAAGRNLYAISTLVCPDGSGCMHVQPCHDRHVGRPADVLASDGAQRHCD